jgi:hypothetical protein
MLDIGGIFLQLIMSHSQTFNIVVDIFVCMLENQSVQYLDIVYLLHHDLWGQNVKDLVFVNLLVTVFFVWKFLQAILNLSDQSSEEYCNKNTSRNVL